MRGEMRSGPERFGLYDRVHRYPSSRNQGYPTCLIKCLQFRLVVGLDVGNNILVLG
jgi:hypothetical protein